MTKRTLVVTKLSDVKVRVPCKHCGETRSIVLKEILPSDLAINCSICQKKIVGAFKAIKLLKGLAEGNNPKIYIEAEYDTQKKGGWHKKAATSTRNK